MVSLIVMILVEHNQKVGDRSALKISLCAAIHCLLTSAYKSSGFEILFRQKVKQVMCLPSVCAVTYCKYLHTIIIIVPNHNNYNNCP